MTTREYLDRLPAEGEWFGLDVMKTGNGRKWDWVALLVDVDPDDLKHYRCETAWLYVHPGEYRPSSKWAQEAWVRIPGKHRNKDAAWDAFLSMMN